MQVFIENSLNYLIHYTYLCPKHIILSKQVIADLYRKFDKVKDIVKAVKGGDKQIEITNLAGSSLSMVISSVYQEIQKTLLMICNDKEEAIKNMMCFFTQGRTEGLIKLKIQTMPIFFWGPKFWTESILKKNLPLL